METMSVNKALAELKLLDSRISKGLDRAVFGGVVVNGKLKYGEGNQDIESVTDNAKSSLQSTKELIKRRNKIKSAVVLSNATTTVEINKEKMTVAEAIERKTSIDYERSLLSTLKSSYSKINYRIEQHNARMTDKLDEKINQFSSGKDSKDKSSNEVEMEKAMVENYKLMNEASMLDPINLEKEIVQLDDSIDGFLSEVDQALTESNVITKIEV